MVADRSAWVREIEQVILAELSRWGVPGASVGIHFQGVDDLAAFGLANVETRHPVGPDTLFQIGSISKIFTTTLVLTFVDEGRLDLDTPIVAYLDDFRLADAAAARTITLRHLLTHTAGFDGVRLDDHGQGDDALARAVAGFVELPQLFPPGECWSYCNGGFDLLGRIVERVEARPIEEVMRERVIERLGLERTTYFAHEAIRHSAAVGHLQDDQGRLEVARPWHVPRRSHPSAGVITTAAEMLRFLRCHLDDGEYAGRRLLSSDLTRAMRARQLLVRPGRRQGLGWALLESGGAEIVSHIGITLGFAARVVMVPVSRFAMVVLTNGDRGDAAMDAIVEAALSRFVGIETKHPVVIPASSPSLSPLSGRYRLATEEFRVYVAGDRLQAEQVSIDPLTGAETVAEAFDLAAVEDGRFLAIGGVFDRCFAEFLGDGQGHVRFMRIFDLVAPRIGAMTEDSQSAGTRR
ncbi:MAG: hypothetical protein QOF01_120 [Thermomicrobiales bacterium]|jgi:CubicO group peptidase (beta-lactamase class C family)|nr:hypothetical protein [Thermomicrobiales bacterium]